MLYPTRIDHYSNISFLRRGGSSYILKAKQDFLDRYVALKILIPHPKIELKKKKFLNEAKTLASLDHSNIVKIFDFKKCVNTDIIVMELLDGITLQDYITINGPLNIFEAIPIIEQICSAIDYIHSKQIVHRDIKPSNIFICNNKTIKLLDFGLSASLTDILSLDKEEKKFLFGTLDYAAPELISNPSLVTKALDIYSLGATIYFMFFGCVIFDNLSMLTKIRKKNHGFYPYFQFIDKNLDDLLHKMLANNNRIDNIDIIRNKIKLFKISNAKNY